MREDSNWNDPIRAVSKRTARKREASKVNAAAPRAVKRAGAPNAIARPAMIGRKTVSWRSVSKAVPGKGLENQEEDEGKHRYSEEERVGLYISDLEDSKE